MLGGRSGWSASRWPRSSATTGPLIPGWIRAERLSVEGERGLTTFIRSGCFTCHTYLGSGARNLGAPDLSAEARRGRGRAWQIRHLKCPGCLHHGSPMPKFAGLSESPSSSGWRHFSNSRRGAGADALRAAAPPGRRAYRRQAGVKRIEATVADFECPVQEAIALVKTPGAGALNVCSRRSRSCGTVAARSCGLHHPRLQKRLAQRCRKLTWATAAKRAGHQAAASVAPPLEPEAQPIRASRSASSSQRLTDSSTLSLAGMPAGNSACSSASRSTRADTGADAWPLEA